MKHQEILYSRIEGQGAPLLVFHGYLGMSDNWKTLSNRFAQEGFEVHTLDLRNHGRSFHADDFSYPAMIDDVLKYCKHYNLKKVNIIGHSMGGKLAMFLAVNYPDLIDKLIVVDISVRAYPPHHQDILEALNSVDFSEQKSRKEIEEVIAKYINDFGTRQFLMKNIYRETPQQLGFRMNLKVLTEQYDNMGVSLPEGARYHHPVLFVRGGKSNYIRERDVQDIQVHFPKAIIETVPNASHWVHSESPEEFFEFAMGYLKNK